MLPVVARSRPLILPGSMYPGLSKRKGTLAVTVKSSLSSLVKSKPSLSSPVDARSGAPPLSPDWRSRGAALLPWGMLMGFLALLAVLFGDRLIPARALTIATVVTVRQGGEVADAISDPPSVPSQVPSDVRPPEDVFDGAMLFQASGWIEPDPYPVMATALVDGIIKTVEVLEGEDVQAGQLLATLVDDDARLDLDTARNQLASLRSQAAAQGHEVAVAEAEIASLGKQVTAARARRDETADLADRLERSAASSAGSVAEREVARNRLELATREAEIEALAVTEAELKAKLRQLEETSRDYEARIAEAETEVARRKLALDRTRIESPIDGRVLRLLAMPGQKKMLRMDDHLSSTVAILYDPRHLQARIDVPLAEAAGLAIGQPVRLRSELLPDAIFRGRVTRIVGEADLQRNTLQAKVTIENPDDRLRPEMLCRAEFLAFPSTEDSDRNQADRSKPLAKGTRVRVFLPSAAVLDEDGSGSGKARVWRVDSSGNHVIPQSVTLGREFREDHRLVLEGLRPGDRVVLDPPPDLEAGERFRAANVFPASSASPSSTSP